MSSLSGASGVDSPAKRRERHLDSLSGELVDGVSYSVPAREWSDSRGHFVEEAIRVVCTITKESLSWSMCVGSQNPSGVMEGSQAPTCCRKILSGGPRILHWVRNGRKARRQPKGERCGPHLNGRLRFSTGESPSMKL